MKMRRSWMTVLVLGLLTGVGMAQSWSQAYETGLSAARSGKWADARAAFRQAAAYRTEDVSAPTNLPGPATERRLWRNGAPYSPNFLAAYAGYRAALSAEPANRSTLLTEVAKELETLLAKGQNSHETFFVLNNVYTQLGDSAARSGLDDRFQAAMNQMTWKVDTEILAPEDLALIAQMSGRAVPAVTEQPVTTVPTTTPTTPTTTTPTPSLPMGTGIRVTPVPDKFALVIGNSASRLPGGEMAFGADDAQIVREALLNSAGYRAENVDVVVNATATQLMASASALADRIPDNATVLIYFSGVGANIDGRDFLAGVDTESPTDTSSMVAKMDLYRVFLRKGARVFAFFQAHRPIVGGRYFGMEIPMVGALSQSQATIPGEMVYGIVRNGKTLGLYTDAFVRALNEIRANRVAISDFGWQVFYKVRGSDSQGGGGSSRMTPTLPVLTNMSQDSRF